MSNRHQILKDARKAGTARTDQEQTFKKPFQTVVRPPTIDHNMHDDYVHNPPKNVAEGETMPRSSARWVAQGKIMDEELGRIKHLDVEREMIEENAVHA